MSSKRRKKNAKNNNQNTAVTENTVQNTAAEEAAPAAESAEPAEPIMPAEHTEAMPEVAYEEPAVVGAQFILPQDDADEAEPDHRDDA